MKPLASRQMKFHWFSLPGKEEKMKRGKKEMEEKRLKTVLFLSKHIV